MTRPLGRALATLLILGTGADALAQQTLSAQLRNGGMEEGAPPDQPPGWRFTSNSGATAVLQAGGAFEGAQCVFIDATAESDGGRPFTNITQVLDPRPWQGKRARFRAAVKVAELQVGSSVQLWFRVDRPDNQPGAFDNMGDRPIKTVEWTHHDIVLDIADDATNVVFGAFIVGRGQAWIDDATFEEVDADVASTAPKRAARRQMSPVLRAAMAAAADAPQQPFFTPWLALPAFALLMFSIAFWPRRRAAAGEDAPLRPRGAIRQFAMFFSIAYWLLYCLPGPFQQLAGEIPEDYRPEFLGDLFAKHAELNKDAVSYTAKKVFDIDGELVPPNGSGDTTFNYISQLNRFALALALALLSSLVTVWVRTSTRVQDVLLDLLRSYLRYVLAFAMLGYGLAKVRMEGNQFPVIGSWQFDKTWGDSSPMNVVWSFMGASRPYTIFAGLSEVLAAVLLIWRRTGTLGALVATAVMTNVVMINFCYDVPVKLYSSHLLAMALVIAAPDMVRLICALGSNKALPAAAWTNTWRGPILGTIRWILKIAIIYVGFGKPIWDSASKTYEYINRPVEVDESQAAVQEPPLVLRRGFRWINEVPFNR